MQSYRLWPGAPRLPALDYGRNHEHRHGLGFVGAIKER